MNELLIKCGNCEVLLALTSDAVEVFDTFIIVTDCCEKCGNIIQIRIDIEDE